MDSIKSIKFPVSGEMKKFEPFFKNSVKSEIPLLNFITNYIIRRKGKQIRPMLVFLAAKMLGSPNRSTFTAATMIELLHTASLIHDDVVDESYERRGVFSVYAIWKTKISVLAGDYLLSKGLLISVKHGDYELLEIITDAAKEMSEGELMQIQKSRKMDITEDEYFEIIRKKTAALISACTGCGAKSVSANPEYVEMAKEYGMHAGIAYQIKDDIFDFQKRGVTGKPAGNDIKEKKLTLPIIHALKNSPAKEKKKILQLIKRNSITAGEMDEISKFVTTYNGINYSMQKIDEHTSKAHEIIKKFPDNKPKNALDTFASYIASRNK